MTKRLGFTLAEVLITLGIIGVVAAMTIPVIIDKYQEQATITKFKKAYKTIQDALAMAQIEEDTLDNWDYSKDPNNLVNNENFVDKYLIKHFNIIKNCKTRKNEGCWQKEKPLLLNEKSYWPYGSYDGDSSYKILTNDGFAYEFGYVQNCVQNSKFCISFVVNLAPQAKKQVFGRNIFIFDAYPGMNQVFPRGIYNHDSSKSIAQRRDSNGNWLKVSKTERDKWCNKNGNGPDWCAGKIVVEGYKINY